MSASRCARRSRRPEAAASRRRATASTPGEKDEPWTATLPVALDEDDQDVLAAQPGQEPVRRACCGSGRGGSRPRTGRRPAGRPRTALHLVHGQLGGAGRGDRRAGQLRAQRPAEHPGDAEACDGPHRQRAVAGHDPGHAQHRQRREDERGDADEHDADDRPDPRGCGRSSRAASRCRSTCSASPPPG